MFERNRLVRWASSVAVGLLVLCAVVLTASNVRRAFFPSAAMLTEPVDTVVNWLDYVSGGTRVGARNASLTVIVYSDYQCPACLQLSVRLALLQRMYPDDIGVSWHHLPLQGHPHAIYAARASICAERFGRFEAMHAYLFDGTDSLGLLPWSEFATRAGLSDTTTFGNCMREPGVQARIDSDVAEARRLHAVATPTFLMNSHMYVGVPKDLRKLVQYHLRHRSDP